MAAATVYVADSDNNRVLKETISDTWSGGRESISYTQSVIVSSLSIPYGVAVDGDGNIYIADEGDSRAFKVSGVDFGTVNVGSASP